MNFSSSPMSPSLPFSSVTSSASSSASGPPQSRPPFSSAHLEQSLTSILSSQLSALTSLKQKINEAGARISTQLRCPRRYVKCNSAGLVLNCLMHRHQPNNDVALPHVEISHHRAIPYTSTTYIWRILIFCGQFAQSNNPLNLPLVTRHRALCQLFFHWLSLP